jgi:hypothetical protein
MSHEADFAYNVSRTYFSVVAAAIRAADPNHLYLGAKFTGIDGVSAVAGGVDGFDAVIRGARGFVDAHSIDVYAFTPGTGMLQHYYDLSGVPWLLAESMGFRSTINLSGNPNTLGAGPIMMDQAARAAAWRTFARKSLALPFLVGINHFTWADEPPGGRPGGEDSNYGLLSVDGLSYSSLQLQMAEVLAQASALHRAGRGKCVLDSAIFTTGGPPGRLQLASVPNAAIGVTMRRSASASQHENRNRNRNRNRNSMQQECLQAQPNGMVAAVACASAASAVVAMATQHWEIVPVGGATGYRLRNVGSGGCMHIELADTHSHALRADANCSTPADWHWPPSWEHDDDCAMMQYCGYPNNASWAHNVCTYDQSCVEVGEGGAVVVAACTASISQRFAFIM